MSPRWVRLRPTPRQDAVAGLAAGAVAAGVGLATFYVARLLLAREPLEEPPAPHARHVERREP